MVKPVKNLHGLSPVEDWIQYSQYVEQERDALARRVEQLRERLNEVPREVPTNWCDSLLTGGSAVIKTADGREVEALLLGIQTRQRDFVAKALADDDKENL